MTLRLLGGRIRRERKRTGLTLETLSELAGISTSFLGYLERGERMASLATIERIAEALRIAPSRLLSDDPQILERGDGHHRADAVRRFARMIRKSSREELLAVLDVVRAFLGIRRAR